MQEEVEQRIVSLMISCGKLGEQESVRPLPSCWNS